MQLWLWTWTVRAMWRKKKIWMHQMEEYAASCRTKVLVLVPENEVPTKNLDRVHLCNTYSFLAMPWSAGGQVNVVLRGSRLVQRLSFDCRALGRGMV